MGKASGKGSGSLQDSSCSERPTYPLYPLKGGHATVLPAQPSLKLRDNDAPTVPVQPSPETPLLQHHRPKGLLNVGNTCYANAVLQCLLSTALPQALLDPNAGAIFRRYSSNPVLLEQGSGSVDVDDLPLREDDSRSSRRRRRRVPDHELSNNNKWLTRELKTITLEYHMAPDPEPQGLDLFTAFLSNPHADAVVDPGSITRRPDRLSPCLRPYQQEDAHEFLRALLGTLVMNGQNKQLSSLFDGLLESAVTCKTCQRPSLTRDRYMDLSLDIDRPHISTLTEALSEYTRVETLQGDNQVHCSRCGGKQDASKGLRLATAPSILVCHLKRFALDEYGRAVRVHKHVHFPERLFIGSYMSKANKGRPPPYELVALLVHQGSTCDSGHYLAFCKHAGDWYQCNDSVVQKVDLKTVLSQQAYILMYEVADMRENHGYPSPHSKRHVKAKRESVTTLMPLTSGYFCGFDDSFLRDVCCYDPAAIFGGRSRRKPAPETARDDSTLSDTSTIESRSTGLRRSSSSGNIKAKDSRLYRDPLRSSFVVPDSKRWTKERTRELPPRHSKSSRSKLPPTRPPHNPRMRSASVDHARRTHRRANSDSMR